MTDMGREDIIERILETAVIAIVRLDDGSQLGAVAEAIQAGGIDVIEFTMTTPGALDAIAEAAANSKGVLIGAGTVLDADTARKAIDAGAEFIVSPATDPRVISAAHEHDKAALPGAYTPTEIVRAIELGADLVKLFPAGMLGPNYIKAIKGPLPHARLLPTGGVSLENAAAFFKAGAAAIAVGTELVNNQLVRDGNFEAITRTAHQFAQIVGACRGARVTS